VIFSSQIHTVSLLLRSIATYSPSHRAQNVKLQLASRIAFRSVDALRRHDRRATLCVLNSSMNCARCDRLGPSLSSLKHTTTSSRPLRTVCISRSRSSREPLRASRQCRRFPRRWSDLRNAQYLRSMERTIPSRRNKTTTLPDRERQRELQQFQAGFCKATKSQDQRSNAGVKGNRVANTLRF
jgi:hypothetical protein